MSENCQSANLIEVKNLKKYFDIKDKGKLHAVDDVSFKISKSETLGLVGESGCGKSTVGNVLMRLSQATGGQVFYEGKNIFELKGSESLEYHKRMQMVFQDPYSSLNPKKNVKSILSEAFLIHKLAKGSELLDRIKLISDMTGITEDLWDKYPHELDGGKRQIIGIARALSLSPKFIVCDEPVSSLDVSIQAKIINLLMELQEKLDLSYLFISHDLSVVRHISKRVAVMYLGKIVEITDTDTIFENPMHPYTIALLSAVPKMDVFNKISRIVLKGDVPSPLNPKPNCCRFAPRCWMAEEICSRQEPQLVEEEDGHFAACHFCRVSAEKEKQAERTSLV